jgi:hypothetical protein
MQNTASPAHLKNHNQLKGKIMDKIERKQIKKAQRKAQQQAVAAFLIAAEHCNLFKNLPTPQRVVMVPALSRLLGVFPKPVEALAEYVKLKDLTEKMPGFKKD